MRTKTVGVSECCKTKLSCLPKLSLTHYQIETTAFGSLGETSKRAGDTFGKLHGHANVIADCDSLNLD